MVDSSIGSMSEVGSESDSVVGLGFALSAVYVLGMQANYDFAHSVTEEFIFPSIL